ncbi:thermostable hemolysin [Parablastomonas sp. CN1-191]|uniref:thermostable hemolysin n=1 Tax=Parablastomonas sp. CN1-191 TaxID=3400908 RepID=UPI003BF8785F
MRKGFSSYLVAERSGEPAAALGFNRCGDEALFLERYLDRPIELAATEALGRPVERGQIVEIGNFASTGAFAMIDLWTDAANDLGGGREVAVSTLTAPLRAMFARIGVPIVAIGDANAARLGDAQADWGTYYALDPKVCVAAIAVGQAALRKFAARRQRRLCA